MTGRIPFGFIAVLTVLAVVPTQAQEIQSPPAGYALQSAVAQPGVAQPDPNAGGTYFGIPLNYSFQRAPVGCPPDDTYYRELPDDLGFFDQDTPLGNYLINQFRHGWFRGELLSYNVSGPGNQLLSGQTLSGVRQTDFGFAQGGGEFFNTPNVPISQGLNFLQTVNGVAGTSQAPTLGDFSIANMPGFRGTFGLPIANGDVELSGFVLNSNKGTSFPASIQVPGTLIQGEVGTSDPFWTLGNPATVVGTSRNPDGTFTTVTANGLPPENPHPTTFFSQAATLNGQLSDSTFINYDVSYQSKLVTALWGTEGNYVFNSIDPGGAIRFRPTVGFRYFNFRDRLEQMGQAYVDATRTTVVTRAIGSNANNNLYGPQASIRAEAGYSRFVIGFEPKIMLGLNTWSSNLYASNVFTPGVTQAPVSNNQTTFAPLLDLKLYGSAALSKYVSAYISYNYLWSGSIVRSYNDIIYNSPNLGLTRHYTATEVQGLSIGFDFKY